MAIRAPLFPEPYCNGARLRVTEEGARLLGLMGWQDVADAALVRHACIAPGAQRKGVDTQLLHHLERFTEKPIFIGTWAAAEWAIGFYRRNGDTVVSNADKEKLHRKYRSIPVRQVEASILLVDAR